MNLEKVIFGFFVLLAATLNFGFFIGDIADPELHNIYELFAALVVSLIATVLKFGDRTQIGAVHLATSLVADLQLIAAGVVWVCADADLRRGHDREADRPASSPCPAARCWPTCLGRAAGGRDRHVPPRLKLVLTVSNPLLVFWGHHANPMRRFAQTGSRGDARRLVTRHGPGRPSARPPRRSSWSCGGCGRR